MGLFDSCFWLHVSNDWFSSCSSSTFFKCGVILRHLLECHFLGDSLFLSVAGRQSVPGGLLAVNESGWDVIPTSWVPALLAFGQVLPARRCTQMGHSRVDCQLQGGWFRGDNLFPGWAVFRLDCQFSVCTALSSPAWLDLELSCMTILWQKRHTVLSRFLYAALRCLSCPRLLRPVFIDALHQPSSFSCMSRIVTWCLLLWDSRT